MDELKKILEALGKAFEEYKSANDARIEEMKKGGSGAEFEAKLARIEGELKRLDEEKGIIEAKMSRPGFGGGCRRRERGRFRAQGGLREVASQGRGGRARRAGAQEFEGRERDERRRGRLRGAGDARQGHLLAAAARYADARGVPPVDSGERGLQGACQPARRWKRLGGGDRSAPSDGRSGPRRGNAVYGRGVRSARSDAEVARRHLLQRRVVAC